MGFLVMLRPATVYVLECVDEHRGTFCKVGVSADVWKRVPMIKRIYQWFDISLVYEHKFDKRQDALKVEKMVRESFKGKEILGREFFSVSKELMIEEVKRMVKNLEMVSLP